MHLAPWDSWLQPPGYDSSARIPTLMRNSSFYFRLGATAEEFEGPDDWKTMDSTMAVITCDEGLPPGLHVGVSTLILHLVLMLGCHPPVRLGMVPVYPE